MPNTQHLAYLEVVAAIKESLDVHSVGQQSATSVDSGAGSNTAGPVTRRKNLNLAQGTAVLYNLLTLSEDGKLRKSAVERSREADGGSALEALWRREGCWSTSS